MCSQHRGVYEYREPRVAGPVYSELANRVLDVVDSGPRLGYLAGQPSLSQDSDSEIIRFSFPDCGWRTYEWEMARWPSRESARLFCGRWRRRCFMPLAVATRSSDGPPKETTF